MNSPINPHSHSPHISGSTTLGGKNVARETNRNLQINTLNSDPLARLVGRANAEKIMVNGKSVIALLDTGSQVTHMTHDYCQAMGIPIHPITQLVHIEGTGGILLNMWASLRQNYPFQWGPMCLRLRPSYWSCPLQNIIRGCLQL